MIYQDFEDLFSVSFDHSKAESVFILKNCVNDRDVLSIYYIVYVFYIVNLFAQELNNA